MTVYGGLSVRAGDDPGRPVRHRDGNHRVDCLRLPDRRRRVRHFQAPSTEVQISNGNAALSGTNYNALSWTGSARPAYNVYGRTHSAESLLAQVTGTTYNDTGAASPAAAVNLLTGTTVTPSFIGGTTEGLAVNGTGTIAADTTTGPNVNGCSLKVITSGASNSGPEQHVRRAGAVHRRDVHHVVLRQGQRDDDAFLDSKPAFAVSRRTCP